MADQIQHRLHTEATAAAPADQPGLEAVPRRYSTTPNPYDPSEFQSPPGKSTRSTMTQAYHPMYASAVAADAPPAERRRVLGLTVPVFWGLVIALVMILTGGIAGGVAGGLAVQKADGSAVSVDPSSTASATSSTTRSIPTGLRSAPTDGGCPSGKLPDFTPTDGAGNEIQIGSDLRAQTFRQKTGAVNPDLYDILQVYVSTFEECMTLCAAHNKKYEANLASGYVKEGGVYCRSVVMLKTLGGSCYLKNNTGKVDTQDRAGEFVSGVLTTVL
ncbi:hypothetical protein BDP81DRAFT_35927 [Colletotrichum phormii]|uniref:Apple domain-containing protein n=1 Tax=Colletotrichum phormii TaxID=359342 RepID=A0AAI9ZQE6_9PEZI|nr:uncharacterized protein BDP81DRAFT_35927 [Colletotrichum phormii]KAK1636271.1 hypothetical protein BDP81DRAFT_35927 [Colletotrichum phormii]